MSRPLNKPHRFQVKMSSEELKTLHDLAAAEGKKAADYVRTLIAIEKSKRLDV